MFDDSGPSERAYRDGFEDGYRHALWMVAIGAAMRLWQITDVRRWVGAPWSDGHRDAFDIVVDDALFALASLGDEDARRLIND